MSYFDHTFINTRCRTIPEQYIHQTDAGDEFCDEQAMAAK